jgi:hypothetical protein
MPADWLALQTYFYLQQIIMNANAIQVIVVKRPFAIRVFGYKQFYFTIMRRISILSAATVEAAAQVQWVARGFTDSLHHFDSGDYKVWSLMVYHSENPRVCYTFAVLRVFDIRGDSQESNPAYNESHPYTK